jgi:hypothetical protein
MTFLMLVVAGWVGLAALGMLVILPMLAGSARSDAEWDAAVAQRGLSPEGARRGRPAARDWARARFSS